MKKTLRDEFAMAALGTAHTIIIYADKDAILKFVEEKQLFSIESTITCLAYEIADEMLKHREKQI